MSVTRLRNPQRYSRDSAELLGELFHKNASLLRTGPRKRVALRFYSIVKIACGSSWRR